MGLRPLVRWIWIVLSIAACTGQAASPSSGIDATGILLVDVGEQV